MPDETRALLGVTEERQGRDGRELVLGEQGLRLKRQMDVQVRTRVLGELLPTTAGTLLTLSPFPTPFFLDLGRRRHWLRHLAGDRRRLHLPRAFPDRLLRAPLTAGVLTTRRLGPAPGQFYETLAASFTVAEALWEGIFSTLSAVIILVTGLSFLSLDRARIKWRIKLSQAFSEVHDGKKGWSRGKWALWSLPFITILREGLEGVIFVAGVRPPLPVSTTCAR